jgi:exopolyphosphatase/guanosine-5'-triphosphate,3'-diphosphate pyrophosphatase
MATYIGEFAVIEIGANSVQLAVYRSDVRTGYQRLCELDTSYRMRLADLSDRRQHLPSHAIDRLVDTVRQFNRYCESARVSTRHVHAVATSAIRDAANCASVLNAIETATGVEVRVLTQQEEATFAAIAVTSKLPGLDGLVVDVGAGALRAARVRGGRVTATRALPLGTLSLRRQFLATHSAGGMADALLRSHVASHCVTLRDALAVGDVPPRIVGIGGALKALARMALAQQGVTDAQSYHVSLDRPAVAAWVAQLRALGGDELRSIPGARAAQADTVPFAAVIADELTLALGASHIEIVDASMRDGVASALAFTPEARSVIPHLNVGQPTLNTASLPSSHLDDIDGARMRLGA